MKPLHRTLAGLLTVCLMLTATHVGQRAVGVPVNPGPLEPAETAWPMFGGTPGRNMVNLRERGLPEQWSIEEGKEKNIKWVADLGSRSYGGPVVAGGRVYVGTNNQRPRDP